MDEERFLQLLYEEKKIDSAIDLVFNKFDTKFIDGEFAEVDHILEVLDYERLESSVILGVLTASSWAKSKLVHRPAFLANVEILFIERHGRVKTDKLLEGLR